MNNSLALIHHRCHIHYAFNFILINFLVKHAENKVCVVKFSKSIYTLLNYIEIPFLQLSEKDALTGNQTQEL